MGGGEGRGGRRGDYGGRVKGAKGRRKYIYLEGRKGEAEG